MKIHYLDRTVFKKPLFFQQTHCIINPQYSLDDIGMPPIRYALWHDFDALNKNELVGFDAWHSLINKPEDELSEEDRCFLDEVAELTIDVDSQLDSLRSFYKGSSYGQAIERKLSSVLV